jgi:hypothetical protein
MIVLEYAIDVEGNQYKWSNKFFRYVLLKKEYYIDFDDYLKENG